MKTVLSALVVMAGILGGAAVASAEDVVVAKVPFAFVVNGVQLPAGDYVISRDTRNPDLVSISTRDGKTALTLSRPGHAGNFNTEQPKLEFARIGLQVYLTQVTLGPGNTRDIVVPAK